MDDEFIYIGKIVNTHGIKGEIRILSDFKYKDRVFLSNRRIYIGEERIEEIIDTYRRHKIFDMITLKGYNNINQVLKYMKNRDWDVNHQNYDGNTFGHYLASINYVNVLDIIKQLKKNKDFSPNIKNKKGETLLDKSINENYIYTTLKILEDKRFNNIDIVSFKKIFDTYITSSSYGKYSKFDNLKSIVNSLEKKDSLLPNVRELVEELSNNMDIIKKEIMTNKYRRLEYMINEFV